MNLLNYFSNLKISRKLGVGFGLILLATLIIVASGLMSLSNIQDKVAKSGLSVDMVNNLTTARLARINYQFTDDKHYLEQIQSALAEIGKSIDRLELLDWAPDGRKSLTDTETVLKNFAAAMSPFLAALEKRQYHENLLNSKTLYQTSMQADRLSRSEQTAQAQRVEASQVAFVLNDIDTMLTDYKKRPTEELQTALASRLTNGIADAQQLLALLPADHEAWLTSALQEMNAFNAELGSYRSSWLEQERLSEQLTIKARELTSAVNALFLLEQQTVKSTVASSARQMGYVALIGTILAMLFAWQITRSITHPLNETLKMAGRIARGDLTSTLDSDRQDEPGLLMQAVSSMNGSLKGIIQNVRQGVESVSRSSAEIAAGNMDLASRTEQQSAAVIETASSIEELTSTVALNAQNAKHARQLAETAAQKATEGNQISQNVIETMKNVRSSSQRISEITTVINSIAFQTNILALNAAVEAARAGDQGKGFAVVAGEVRNLAQRSAQSAKEIESLIHESATWVDNGFCLVEGAGVTMADIESSVTELRNIMGEIAVATEEQSRGISQIAQAMAEMDATTQQNAALVEESSAAAGSLENQALQLEKAVSVFRVSEEVGQRQARRPVASNG
ncbi:methyl-accepting chemotaxis protein [Dryocola sp. BD613]|uniref:methyl-accepting chemotaxis protein n=1 Tax=Dryocola sp. BD613 TaxID=3133272 RepID=UPI003F4F563F